MKMINRTIRSAQKRYLKLTTYITKIFISAFCISREENDLEKGKNRKQIMQSCINSNLLGIEIAPCTNPIARKKEGFNTLVVDLYDQETLKRIGVKRGFPREATERIESVDFVGDASNLLDMVWNQGGIERVCWILSCHNFEHLPNPLKFLKDCSQLLYPDGILVMAIPDKRFCFDRFQPISTTAEIIQADLQYFEPYRTAWTKFRQESHQGAFIKREDGKSEYSWSWKTNEPDRLQSSSNIRISLEKLKQDLKEKDNLDFDGHRWHFTPSAFELILLDLRFSGLLNFTVERIWDKIGNQFIVKLILKDEELQQKNYFEHRNILLRQMEDESAVVANVYKKLNDC